jgi:chromosome segregation ATPase
MSKDSKK